MSFFCCLPLLAQDLEFENISTANGLSHNDVNCILQDKQGFMWFGTNDGLNRYDGYDFNIYRYDVDGDKGLNSNRIKSLAEDKNNNIWIGTTDGLNILQYLDQSILNTPSIDEKPFPLMDKESVLGIDIIDNLAVVLTKEAVFFFKILKNGYAPVKVADKYFLKTGSTLTNCYYRVSNNEFIIGTKHGLKRFRLHRDKGLKIDITNHEKKINVLSIVPYKNGILSICRDGIYYLDKHFKFNLVLPGEFNCLLIEDENRLWVGNNFGLHHIVFENDTLKKVIKRAHYTNQNTNGGLGSNFVTSIYKDKQGVIWLGTSGGGLSKLINRNNKFKLFRNKQEGTNFKENIINCFFEDSKGNLWLGTDRSGILYFSSGIYNYHLAPKQLYDSKKTIDDILAIHEIIIANKPYIIASTSYHLDIRVYNTNAQPVTNLPLYKALHKTTHPVSIMVSDEKYLWLGTREGGLYRYDYKTDNLQRFLKSENPTLCSNYINTLYTDSKNNLWIGTDKGLNVLVPKEQNKINPNFKIYTHTKTNPKSLSYNNVLAILEHDNKDIWIGTLGGGLNTYNFNTDSFSRLTVSDGLASNSIKGILADNKNQLWISSNNGISCLNLSNKKITNFGVSDGLQDFEFRRRASFKRKNGQMLFGGNNGFNSFFPEQIKIDSTVPQLVFTGLNLVRPSNNQDVFYNRAQLSKLVKTSTAIKLKYNENSFTAYFSALDYFAPAEIQYKYRLTGFEESWVSMDSNSRFAKYTNLNPGNYVLEVLCTNSDGVWLNKPLQLHIYIGKAWYMSTFAFLLYALLLVAAFVFFNRFSLIRNEIKNNLLMERFEKEKVKQLSQLKLRFFTNISHELRTPVTIIKSYFENIAPNWKNLPEKKINKDISVITRNINSLNELLNQLLDFTKLEQDKMTIFPVKSDFVKLMESCISSFNIVAVNKQIELTFLHESEALEFWFDEDKMEIIINNMLSNALKYTKDGGQVMVRLTELAQEIKIEIEDTGIGIPQSIQANIFERFYQAGSLKKSMKGSSGIGLSLTKGLIDLHKGRIELISSESNGSNFILFFKKGSSHFKDLDLQHLNPKQHTLVIETSHNPIQEAEKNKVHSREFIEKTILIVEDNEDIRLFLVEKLKNFFKVDFAENGKIGLEKCIEKSPDVIISDIMMPEMNGYELCDAIKNNEAISHIPVILLTAKTTIESELQGFKLGADAYVAKPFNLDVLVARIESILKSREKIWKKVEENPFFSPHEVSFTAKDEQFLQKITTIIETQMANPDFSVEQLAEKYKISQINLNNKIKALIGKTTVQFIRLIRLRRAAELLKTKHSRVSDVTYDVGYSDLQHFRLHFKEEFSLSPSAYKKKYS